MGTAALEAIAAPADADVLSSVRALVLGRAAAQAGATRSELTRDLGAFVSHKLSPAAWRCTLDRTLRTLETENLIGETRGRVTLTPQGRAALGGLVGAEALPTVWTEMRDMRLVASALGLEAEAATRLKSLIRPDGLRAAILQKAYGLRIKGVPSPARLRSALAVVALERAFGSNIRSGLGTGGRLPAKAGRLLAGQLSRRPRDFGTDSRLIAALAAEQVGAVQTDADALRVAILRNFVSQSFTVPMPPPHGDAENARTSGQQPPPQVEPAAAPHADLEGFARAVKSAARTGVEGWPGNGKALISHVWQTIQVRHPEWGLTDTEFKAMLVEAHRMGHLALASADLKDKRNIKEFQESAVAFKNAVWHFVRVED